MNSAPSLKPIREVSSMQEEGGFNEDNSLDEISGQSENKKKTAKK